MKMMSSSMSGACAPVGIAPAGWERGGRRDRLARGLILGAGALCFVLLAWVHLGLGALVIPPPRTVPTQVTMAGPLRVTLGLESGQLTAAGPNTVSLTITDSAGRQVTNATVVAHLTMRTMAMDAPDVAATPTSAGRYLAHPKFAMAGPWRLTVTTTQPGQPPHTATFDVNARWN